MTHFQTGRECPHLVNAKTNNDTAKIPDPTNNQTCRLAEERAVKTFPIESANISWIEFITGLGQRLGGAKVCDKVVVE